MLTMRTIYQSFDERTAQSFLIDIMNRPYSPGSNSVLRQVSFRLVARIEARTVSSMRSFVRKTKLVAVSLIVHL